MKLLPVIIILFLSMLITWNYVSDLGHLKEHNGGTHYIKMVEGKSTTLPYCYRILVPKLCFGSVSLGYIWIGLGLFFCALGLFKLVNILGGDLFAQWTAVLLFMFWHETVNEIFWFVLPDLPVMATIIWSYILIWRKKYWLSLAIVILGVMFREIAFVVLPFIIWILWNRKVSWKFIVGYVLFPLGIWLTLFLNIDPIKLKLHPFDTLDPIEMFTNALTYHQGKFFAWKGYMSYLYIVLPLVIAGFNQIKDKRFYLLFLPLVGIFFAGDSARIVLFSFAGVFTVAGLGLSELLKKVSMANKVFVLSVLTMLFAMDVREITILVFLTIALVFCGIEKKEISNA